MRDDVALDGVGKRQCDCRDDAGGQAAGGAGRTVRGRRLRWRAILITVRRGDVAVRAVAVRLHRHWRVTVPGLMLRMLQVAADARAQRGEPLQRERRDEECGKQKADALVQHGRGL